MTRRLRTFDPAATFITRFAAGHGWTVVAGPGTVASDLNYTTGPKFGTQCVTTTTAGTGVASAITRTGLAPINLTGQNVIIWVRVRSGLAHLAQLALRCGSPGLTSYYSFNIFSLQGLQEGEWCPLACSFAAATTTGTPSKSNITDLMLRVVDSGGPVTIDYGAVGHFTPRNAYPAGVVSMTFDDNTISQHTIGAPKLAEYGWGGTMYAVHSWADTAGYTTTDQLHELENTYGWEVAGHVYGAHVDMTTLTAAEVDADLAALRQWLIAEDFAGADLLAYPYGAYNLTVEAAARRYFRANRIVGDHSRQTLPCDNPFRIRSFNVQSGTSAATIQAAIDAAQTNGTWLPIMWHKLLASGPTGSDTTITIFNTIVDYCHTVGVQVVPLGQVLSSLQLPYKPAPLFTEQSRLAVIGG